MKNVSVYIVDLCHNQFGLARSSLSLGIGTIGAYLIKKYGENVNVKLFTVYEDLMEAIKNKEPNIVGLANFNWNENLNVKTMSNIRRDYPNVLMISGGSNVSPYGATDFSTRKKPLTLVEKFCIKQDLQILAKFPHVDYFTHGDGELPVSLIVEEFIKRDCSRDRMINEKVTVPGSSLVYENKLIFGGPGKLLRSLDEFDSPYALGLYDDILSKYDLVPQIETDRGCPFECGFCTLGGWTNVVTKHSVEWVKKEILHLREHSKIKMLRIANSNFGLLKHDVEISRFIKKLRDDTGYPAGLRVYSAARGANDRVKNLMKELSDLLPLNLSFQSLTGEALQNVSRINQKDDVVADMSRFAIDNNLMLSTEIILGLPGENYESLLDTYSKLFKYGFESVISVPLVLIRGSDLWTDEAREKYKFKTKFLLLEKSVSVIDGELLFEYDECPVESSSYNEEEYWGMYRASIFVYMTCRGGYYKELYRYALNNNITFSDIFLEIKNNPSYYPLFSQTMDSCIKTIQKFYFSDKESLGKRIKEEIETNGSPIKLDISYDMHLATGKLLSPEYRKTFIDEFTKALTNIYTSNKSNSDDEFNKVIDDLKRYTNLVIISPQELPKERVEYSSNYDIEKWLNEACAMPLSTYKLQSPKTFVLKVRNYGEHEMLSKNLRDWSKRDRCLFYFRQVVSSNHRRIIENFPMASSTPPSMDVTSKLAEDSYRPH